MAINDVILERGDEKPLRITVAMDNPAGVFQVEAVLVKKISTSGLKDHISVEVLVNGDRLELSRVERLHRDIEGDDSETRRGLMSKDEW
jgi:metal-dependent HD superfamily phosphatase/phosphodiesterase